MKKGSTKKTVKKPVETRRKVRKTVALQSVMGMRDILPTNQSYWQQVRKVLEHEAEEYGFSRIDTPILELKSLFENAIGNNSELIEDELYSFSSRSKDEVALRPEMTAGKVRAYIEHGMDALTNQPLKLFSIGPNYRYDKPMDGRYREFFQADFDIFGEMDPVLDAQVIQIAHRVLEKLELTDIQFAVNSVGTPESRKEYKKLLIAYFESNKVKLPSKYRNMIETNPMGIFDSKDDKVLQVCAGAPQAIDHLDKESREHFKNLLEYLDELELPYVINPQLVRGMDYYTKTVFEIYSTDKNGNQYALGGGGRFDRLIGDLGGEPTPAIGFSFGLDRLVLEMKRIGAKNYKPQVPRVYLAQLGELAKKKSLKIFAELENAGILIAESFGRGNLKTQLRQANKIGVDIALIIGQKEALDDTIIIKNMVSGIQETITKEKIISVLKKELKLSEDFRKKNGQTRRVVGNVVKEKVNRIQRKKRK